ncbi:MAG: ribonuclease P protein component [Kiritimatiellia bacterium]
MATSSQPDTPHPARLGRARRMIAARLFTEAREQQLRFPGRYMVLCLRRGADADLRLGVITTRRLGGAVMRNRARRRLRELFRRHRDMLQGRVDVLLLARQGIDRATWTALCREFLKLAYRAGLLPDKTDINKTRP